MTRIGVFLCTCDGQVGQKVQVNAFQYVMRTNPEIALVRSSAHICDSAGVQALDRAIREQQLDRVVVAGCPARFQEEHLRRACTAAGVNVNHFALVDWREGCVTAHRDTNEVITGKAIDLVLMAVARVSQARPVERLNAEIAPHALVIGGGIAGMTAARTLADRGISVTLVERQAALGGPWRAEARDGGAEVCLATREAVLAHPNVRVLLNSRVIAAKGSVGNYRIRLSGPEDQSETVVGAIVVATGAQENHPADLYRYDGRRVVTLGEFQTQPVDLPPSASVVYLLCAGSRDDQVPYCSNVCCLSALNQARRLKTSRPDVRVTILFRDLYLLGDGLNEEVVHAARRAGVEFARYLPGDPPRVGKDAVEVRDDLTHTSRRLEYDRLVLATPLVPDKEAGALAYTLRLPQDDYGFFVDPHHRLRADAYVDRGIFVCGSAHRPVDADTAILQGMTAAARAARWLQQGHLSRPALGAAVDPDLCTGCAQCVQACASGAIAMRTPVDDAPVRASPAPILNRARVDPFLCLGCGNCVIACPSKAIDLPAASDRMIFSQIETALAARQNGQGPVLVFACRWSGIAAMELAGARELAYPASVRAIELPCSARLDPIHVLYAFYCGARVVLLALCPPNECHYGNGNHAAEERIETLRSQLALHGIDPRRLQVARMMGDDAGAWVKAVVQTTRDPRVTGAEGRHA